MVALRPACQDDVPYLQRLVTHPEVAPFLAAVRASGAEELAAEIARAESDPDAFGVVVITEAGTAVGAATWERVNRRSRIAAVSGVALDPEARGRGVAGAALVLLVDELLDRRGFHRIQLEVYGFNTHAASFFERAGFVREGVRRRAYWRNDAWVDGILFGLVAEDRPVGRRRLSEGRA
jgi:RimJ/RimL family protein N-acetyltransferase